VPHCLPHQYNVLLVNCIPSKCIHLLFFHTVFLLIKFTSIIEISTLITPSVDSGALGRVCGASALRYLLRHVLRYLLRPCATHGAA